MKRIVTTLFICVTLFSCNKENKENYSPTFSKQTTLLDLKNEIIIAPHPFNNPERLNNAFSPLINILNKEIPQYKFKLETSKDYADFNAKIKTKRIEIIIPNPYQTIEAMKFNYHVFAKYADDERFRGILLVRKDSNINKISDLKGKTIAYPAPSALAAAMMPKVYMLEQGLNVNIDTKTKYVGSQESSILALYNKEVDAACTWPISWELFVNENNKITDQLKIIFQTESLVNLSLMAHNDVDKKLIASIKKILLNLSNNEEGKKFLLKINVAKIIDGNDKSYEIANLFLSKYKKSFGELSF
jgi:phosphonate transport system substrate-binding protein